MKFMLKWTKNLEGQQWLTNNILFCQSMFETLFLIYCILSLVCNNSLLLSEEEISNMRSELEKYGIQMPAFSKIGGILANELSVDEAACESSSTS